MESHQHGSWERVGCTRLPELEASTIPLSVQDVHSISSKNGVVLVVAYRRLQRVRNCLQPVAALQGRLIRNSEQTPRPPANPPHA